MQLRASDPLAAETLTARPGDIQQRLGRGEPLPPTAAERFGRAYQSNLANVEIHRSSPLATELGADALTVGNHVAFAPGRYNPGTPEGDHLIGHELAHTVQQAGGAGAMQASGLGSGALEREADSAATTALAGGVVSALSPVGHGAVQLRPPSGSTTPLPPPDPGQTPVSLGGRKSPFPEPTAVGKKELNDLGKLDPRPNEDSRIEVSSGQSGGLGDEPIGFTYHVMTAGGGARGAISTSTDISLVYTPPKDPSNGLGVVLVNPEMPYPVLAGPGVPALPIQLHYDRTMSYADSGGRHVSVTVSSVVGFSLVTWQRQIGLDQPDFDQLMAMKGDGGDCSVKVSGSGPLQAYIAFTDNAGVSVDIQMMLATMGLRTSMFAISSSAAPAFLWPQLSGGEQFAAMNAYLQSADDLELARRIEAERKRREDLGFMARFLEDSGIGDVLDAGAKAMASGISWVVNGVVGLWSSLPAPVRGVLEAVGKFAAVVGLVVVAALAAVEIAAAVGVTITVGAAALVIGGVMLAIGLGGSLWSRYLESKQTGKGDVGDIIAAAILDTVGLAPFIEAITDQSILSGRKYNRTTEERWEAGTSGLLQMIGTAFGIKELAGKKAPLPKLPPESPPLVDIGPPKVEIEPPKVEIEPPKVEIEPPKVEIEPPRAPIDPPATVPKDSTAAAKKAGYPDAPEGHFYYNQGDGTFQLKRSPKWSGERMVVAKNPKDEWVFTDKLSARAVEAGYPRPPEGHCYVKDGDGFQLRANPDFAGTPKKVVQKPDGTFDFIDRTDTAKSWAESKKSASEDYKTAAKDADIEAKLQARKKAAGWSEEDLGLVRRWADAMAELRKQAGDKAVDDILAKVDKDLSRGSYDKFRYELRAKMIETILGQKSGGAATTTPAQQMALLRDFLAAMPEQGSQGSLFSTYRAGRLAAENGDITPIKGARKSLDDPGGLLKKSRDSDGAVDVSSDVLEGPKEGKYLVDDKAGKNPFNHEQAKDYSKLAESKDGLSAGGTKYNGLAYFFQDEGAAAVAARYLDTNGLSAKIHVAYFDAKTGALTWLR